ncbi:MAG: hypothetical protein JXR16_17065 [Bermanella sp.]
MDTASPEELLVSALSAIDDNFKEKIVDSFLELKRRFTQAVYSDQAYDAIGLSAGKFCETLLRFLQQELTGKHTQFGSPIRNFADECRKIENLPRDAGPESLRIIIPRCLLFIYTVRNKRGIGHSGGDIDANRTDIGTIVSSSTWIMCELLRIYYAISLEEAQAIVDTLNTRTLPDVWEVMGRKRILRNDLNFKDKTLLLCYTTPNDAVLIEDLFEWTEYSSLSMYRKSVVIPLHESKLIEFDKEIEAVFISPLGIQKVEDDILQ